MNEMNTLKPDIIIISNFTEAIVHGNNDRFDYLAKLLSNSCDVELIGSTFKHYIKKQCTDKERQQTRDFPYKYTCISEPGYPTNICLQRFRSHYVWGHNVIRYLKHRKKPDLIYCAVPSLTGPNLVSKYCEKNYVPFIIDIQDLWPEAFQMVFNVPVVSDVAFAPFKALADGIYKRADQIVAVSQTYVDRALKVNHKVKKGYPVFLGTDLKTFDENARNNPIKREDLNEFWIGYCGSMGDSYDLDIVIDAISIVNKSFKSNSDKKDQYKIKFVAMGDGQMRKEFLDGQEIGADVYIDLLSGEVVSIFTKKKIKMRAGETDKAVSFKDEKLFQLIEKFVSEAGYKGQIDIDIFKIGDQYYISEVNPRFGGGYPHAYESGVDHMKLILNNLNGVVNEKKIGTYKDGIYMMKYNEVKTVESGMEI